jgi:hypothetical protein
VFTSNIFPRGPPLKHGWWGPDGHSGRVAPDCEVQGLDTLEEMVHNGMEGIIF